MDALRQLRLSREEMALKDKETSNRISELLAEKEEAKHEVDETNVNYITELNEQLEAANNEIESNKEQFQSEMEKLDKLYLGKIETLSSRVSQIEYNNSDQITHRSGSSHSNNNSYQGRNNEIKLSTLTKPSQNVIPQRSSSLRTSAANSILGGNAFAPISSSKKPMKISNTNSWMR